MPGCSKRVPLTPRPPPSTPVDFGASLFHPQATGELPPLFPDDVSVSLPEDTPPEELTPREPPVPPVPPVTSLYLSEAGKYSPNQQVSRGKSSTAPPQTPGRERWGGGGHPHPSRSLSRWGGARRGSPPPPAGCRCPGRAAPFPPPPRPSTPRTNHWGRTSPGCGGPAPG